MARKIDEKRFLRRFLRPPFGQKVHLLSILVNFWVPFETPKTTQNQRLAQKVVPGTAFSSICIALTVLFDLLVDFGSFFHEKSYGKTMRIFKVASICLNHATFTKHCNLQVRSYIFSF